MSRAYKLFGYKKCHKNIQIKKYEDIKKIKFLIIYGIQQHCQKKA